MYVYMYIYICIYIHMANPLRGLPNNHVSSAVTKWDGPPNVYVSTRINYRDDSGGRPGPLFGHHSFETSHCYNVYIVVPKT